MRFEASVTAQAPVERVWQVFSDVERWAEWTPTVTSVERLDDGPLRVGARARIRQPKLPVAVWEVTELDAGSYFAWVSTVPGIRTTGEHRVVATAEGTVITAAVTQEGPLGWVFGKLYAELTRRYVTTEVRRLKEVVEG
ncbi:polyketide cyclase [Kribbella sandramycini]|uniref:Polyketide cyclase n=1 Tax=Kribbella sandramycini TaxID=60450 RepID=A0A7Y4KWM6_9ACTN|nr:SRPBCC family protein [Kribbella sandramycini]MBB6567324.1 putative membrane protein [Kribbella sandramycini]NOL40064.1 polyketide cyclase [Kribbella sandramycini]